MSKAADSREPASEVERLIADLSASGPLIFVFGDGFTTTHLTGTTTPVFEGPADLRWWQVELGDDAAKWVMHVRVDQITGIRFVRAPYPFRPNFRGQEVLWVGFLGPGEDTFLHCYVGDLMTVGGCARRSWRPGKRCASGMGIATSHGLIEETSWPRSPDAS